MIDQLHRRQFLHLTAATAAAALTESSWLRPAHADEPPLQIRKAVKYHMIEVDATPLDKLKLLKDIGFDGVEVRTRDKVDRQELLKASETVGLPVHGVINSSDPDIVSAIDLARYLGGTSVLVVAGRVNEKMSYDENYAETQAIIRKAIPHAEKHNIKILVENVWNNFLLSPLEMARYVDEFESASVGVYFDVGNVVRIGWPEQWIRILDRRIGKLDIKEYSRKLQMNEGLRKGFNVELGEGDCGWPAVRQALREIGYTSGWGTAEVKGGDGERLTDIARRMDRVLNLKS